MSTSPNVSNYQYGAGAVYLKVEGVDNDYRHVGNVPSLVYKQDIQTLDHKQSMSGIKSTDFELVTEVTATVEVNLEEVTPENMALFVLGEIATNTDGDRTIGGLTKSQFTADFKFVGDNAAGTNIDYFARVTVKPNGDYSFITDGLNSIPIVCKVIKDEETGNFGLWVFKDEATE